MPSELSENPRVDLCRRQKENNSVSKSYLLMMQAFICDDSSKQEVFKKMYIWYMEDQGMLAYLVLVIIHEALGL